MIQSSARTFPGRIPLLSSGSVFWRSAVGMPDDGMRGLRPSPGDLRPFPVTGRAGSLSAMPPTESFAPAAWADVLETHIGAVFLVGQFAYKLKKPVDFGFLDFTGRADRERACHKEVTLNRRLAPAVCPGLSDGTGPAGRAVA